MATQLGGKHVSIGLVGIAVVTLVLGACGESRQKRAGTSAAINTVGGAPRLRSPKALNVPEQLATSFPLLRSEPERLPRDVTRLLRKPVYGMNWALAQTLPTDAEFTAWLVPGAGILCLLVKTGSLSMTCGRIHRVVVDGLTLTILSKQPRHDTSRSTRFVIGVAPAGATSVALRTGSTTSLLVAGPQGVYTLRDRMQKPPSGIVVR